MGEDQENLKEEKDVRKEERKIGNSKQRRERTRMDGWDGWDGWDGMDGWMEWMDGWMDGMDAREWMRWNGWMDRQMQMDLNKLIDNKYKPNSIKII